DRSSGPLSPGIEKTSVNEVFSIPGLRGPEDLSAFATPERTSCKKYMTGEPSRMAVLLTDSNSAWLGIVHALKTIGVPFIITDDYQKALQHQVVMVYPVISGAILTTDALKALAAFPREGGTLIGIQVLGALNEVFGFSEAIASRQHFEIFIQNDSSILTSEFTDKKELNISLGDKERFKETIGTYSYSKNVLPAIATYEDKSAAIVKRYYEDGRTYAMGFDLGYMVLKAHNQRHEHWNRSDANSFEPTLDVLYRLLKNIYLENDRDAATICTVPYNRELSVVVTHSINHRKFLERSDGFAIKEKDIGLRSSYFIRTGYIRDRHQRLLASKDDLPRVRAIKELGMDLQSNSVCGSYDFDRLPQGNGSETYPDYQPYVLDFEQTYNATVFGEMRISKYLLDQIALGNSTRAFRSSYQYTPFSYPQSLDASGYRFGSTIPANQALTHFPIQLKYNREYERETDVFEFPITDDDELPPYTATERIASAIKLGNQIARYGGCYIGQVHPGEEGWQVEKAFHDSFKNRAWFGTISDFGLWWAARNEVTVDIREEFKKRVVYVNVPKRMEGLALMMPLRSTPVEVIGGGNHSIDGKLIIFEIAEGPIRIILDN
ncbi:MAG: hypothetical protein ACKOKF_05750, partial [Bacteroidota bacterium]